MHREIRNTPDTIGNVSLPFARPAEPAFPLTKARFLEVALIARVRQQVGAVKD
ncbi:hypothetical protein BH11PSE11_BH11PSE11_26610 [soil metagenome]